MTKVNDLRRVLLDAIAESRDVTMKGDLRLADGGKEDAITRDVPLHLHGVRLDQVSYQLGTGIMATTSVTVGLRYLANEHQVDPHQIADEFLHALDGLASDLSVKFEWLDRTIEIVDDAEWRGGTWFGIKMSLTAIPGTTLKFVEPLAAGGAK